MVPAQTAARVSRLAIAIATAAAALLAMPTMAQEKVLRIAMTAAGIPKTNG